MTTDENILTEMFERVTNPSRDTVDNLGVQMFCMIVQGNSALVAKAHELIIKKMHSANAVEADRAIGLLEVCMSKGGSEFQRKTAKFTFLNELIALVTDKHPSTPAPMTTKQRIMECLMLWTVQHQDKTKIQEAYDNLKKQVHFATGSSAANSNSLELANARIERSSILGKDDRELFDKLLKQGGVENCKKANLLIQHRFNQDARRTEFICHLKSELKKIENTMELLNEMLNSYNREVPEAESRDIIQELYNNCKGHSEQMARWPDFLGESEPDFLDDVLNTKDLLTTVIQRCKDIFDNKEQYSVPTKPNASATNTDLFSELLRVDEIVSSQYKNPIKPNNTIKSNDTMDELNEIFGSVTDNVKNNKPHHPSELLTDLDLLEPVSVFGTEIAKPASNKVEEKKGSKDLSEIDKLSEEMFKQCLNEKRYVSFKKETKKVALNDIAKDRIQASIKSAQENNITTTPKCNKAYTTLDDLKDPEENTEGQSNPIFQKDCLTLANDLTDTHNADAPSMSTSKHLTDISIDLDEVTPLNEGQRLLLDDDDIQVTLNFTADRPSEHVSVIVMTVTNKSKLHIKDFQFEASVKKPSKVRLLTPTDVAMAPRKPFRHSTPINQVMLLLNPTQKPVDLTCIIGYKLGDDPDPIKESIVTKDIPYV